MVIWLLGISGSGKSTLGGKLRDFFKHANKNTFLIDGDVVRKFYESELGYSREERRENIQRIIFATSALSESGVLTIVCNISPFEDMRAFARRKIKDYNEIYLKKNLETSIKTDVKKMYEKNLGHTPIVGIDIKFDEPINCDLVIDIKNKSVDDSFNKVMEYLQAKYPEQFK